MITVLLIMAVLAVALVVDLPAAIEDIQLGFVLADMVVVDIRHVLPGIVLPLVCN